MAMLMTATRRIGRCSKAGGGLPIFILARLYSESSPQPNYPEVALDSSSSISLTSPLLMLRFPPQPQDVDVDTHRKNDKTLNFYFFSPVENKFVTIKNKMLPEIVSDAHCVGSSCGWLFLASRRGEFGFYAANVFSCSDSPQIMRLPPVETLDPKQRIFLSRNPSCRYLNRYYFYEKARNFYSDTGSWCALDPDTMSKYLSFKFSMSSSPRDDDCIVMIMNRKGKFPQQELAFCRIGDHSWTCLRNQFDGSCSGSFNDIIYSKSHRLFYVLTPYGHIQAWDLNNPSSPKSTVYPHISLKKGRPAPKHIALVSEPVGKYLVESPKGDMLLVVRCCASVAKDMSFTRFTTSDRKMRYRTVWFDVYKIDFERGIGQPLESIGDTVLFVGCNESFSVSAKEYPELRPNSIYFDDNLCFQFFQYRHLYDCGFDDNNCYMFNNLSHRGGHDSGIFDLQDHKVSPLYHPFEFQWIEPLPSWVLPRPQLK